MNPDFVDDLDLKQETIPVRAPNTYAFLFDTRNTTRFAFLSPMLDSGKRVGNLFLLSP